MKRVSAADRKAVVKKRTVEKVEIKTSTIKKKPRNKGLRGRRAAKAVEVAMKVDNAIDMRISGMTLAEIASKLNCTYSYVSKMINNYLDLTHEQTLHNAGQLVAIELHRLDQIFLAHWPMRAITDNAKILLAVAQQRSKLLGLDAPSKSIIDINSLQMLGSQLDLSKLSNEELAQLDNIMQKAGPSVDPSVVAIQEQFDAENKAS